ncbi:MAG TPA: amidohydrolase [Candidatus Binatia bacterium]|nr:amidohydrolase [Candidatus Binatia bacterium]
MRTVKSVAWVLLLAIAYSAGAADWQKLIEPDLPRLVEAYKGLHAAPELSYFEEKSAAFVANELRQLGFEVTEHIGKYQQRGLSGHGLVAVFKNGAAPVVLVRTDLDALPVAEKTGVPYASKVRMKNENAEEVSVMHACGHDVHMTCFIGTAKLLVGLKEQWKGTLLFVGQPAEEVIAGARAMLADNLYQRFPKPKYALALHDNPFLPAGTVGYTPGYALASSTPVDILVRGIGGHGSKPESAKDPIVLASQIVIALQTLVSRENSPFDPVVLTVGTIQGGTKRNIIPDEVKLELTLRTYKEDVRQRVIASIERTAKGMAIAAGVPAERAPVIHLDEPLSGPPTYNDPALTDRLVHAFTTVLGTNNVIKVDPVMGSEDFGFFSLNQQIPATMFWLGATDPVKFAESKKNGTPLPFLHSPLFAPLPEPTIRTGIIAMTAAVLDLMQK